MQKILSDIVGAVALGQIGAVGEKAEWDRRDTKG